MSGFKVIWKPFIINLIYGAIHSRVMKIISLEFIVKYCFKKCVVAINCLICFSFYSPKLFCFINHKLFVKNYTLNFTCRVVDDNDYFFVSHLFFQYLCKLKFCEEELSDECRPKENIYTEILPTSLWYLSGVPAA